MPVVLNLPKRVTLWHDESTLTNGSGFTVQIDTAAFYNHYVFINTGGGGADGDSFTQSFLLAAGTYMLSMLVHTASNGPKIDVYLDGGLQISGIDCYSGGVVYNVVKTGTLVVPTSDYHVLKVVTNGANAGNVSGSRRLNLTKMWLKQASD